MAVLITHIKKESINNREPNLSIVSFRWINEETQAAGETNREVMYDWVVNKKGQAYIRDTQGNPIYVFGFLSPEGQPYLSTVKNRARTQDLLSLPVF